MPDTGFQEAESAQGDLKLKIDSVILQSLLPARSVLSADATRDAGSETMNDR